MNQIQKYAWLINTIHRSGRISFSEVASRWQYAAINSSGKKLPRWKFNRWRDAIWEEFGIIISCRRVGGYLYYIENPEDIDEDKLKKWMLNTFAAGSTINDNITLKDRILVDEIPSGHDHLSTILEAMKENRVVEICYKPFRKASFYTFPIEPYCVKLFENRWYVLAHNVNYGDVRIYGLDRIESVFVKAEQYELPAGFSADDMFAKYYGIAFDERIEPRRIVLRAYDDHKYYLKSLPLHHTQQMIDDCDEYADFELYLAPTYDFIMKLLQAGPLIEVLAPAPFRQEVASWISKMHEMYK